MAKYKIVTNGHSFRVKEKLGWFLPFWSYIGRYHEGAGSPYDFESRSSAQNWIDRREQLDHIEALPWRDSFPTQQDPK